MKPNFLSLVLTGTGLAATTLFAVAKPANAFGISNTSGNWDNVTLTDGYVIGSDGYAAADWNAVEFLDVGDESQVRWGDASHGEEVTTKWKFDSYSYNYDWGTYTNAYGEEVEGWYNYYTEVVSTYENKSGLGFEGVDGLNIAVGDTFNVGSLTHFNQAIEGNLNVAKSAEFSLDLDFGDYGIGKQTFDFTFSVDETVNNTYGCAYQTDYGKGCSDQITWDWAIDESSSFMHEGQEYTLELVGFAEQVAAQSNIVNEFISQEGGDNSAGLFARLVAINGAEEIPEPASLLGLLGLGLFVAHSRKKRVSQLIAA